MKASSSTSPKTWSRLLAAVLLGGILGAAAVWWWQQDKQTLAQTQQQWQQASQDLEQARLHVQALQTQLVLEQATQDALRQSLAQAQQELGRFQEQLAFYEHLMPLSGTGTVQVRALELEPQGQTLHYKLLAQRPPHLARFNGHIQFTAHGHQGADSVNIVLTTAGLEPTTTTEIEFDRFLRTTGLLQIPADLRIDAVTLQIYEGTQLRATHKMNLVPLSEHAEND